ncbi:MAG: hypothetical protein QME96_09240, partial [Myxococcota bacterium]|nr:hypothetical protein [Myxococcota bacterium]
MVHRGLSVLSLAVTLAWTGSAAAARGGPDRSGYEWVDGAEPGVTYEWHDLGVAPTCVTLGDDAESAAVPLGFTFAFYGADRTQAYVGSNGYVAFQSNDVSSGFGGQCPLPVADRGTFRTVNNAVYGFFQDLNPREPASGTICYATLGVAPDRMFVVTWDHIDYFQQGPTETEPFGSDPVTFQIVLYEGSNEAQVNILESGTTAGLPRWEDNTTIGIENADGTAGLSLCNWTNTRRIPDAYAVRFRRSDGFGIVPSERTGAGAPGGTVGFDFELLNFASTAVTVTVTGRSASSWTVTPSPGSVSAAADGGAAP